MQQPYVIGIDIGTGSVKAIAIDFNLKVIDQTQIFYPLGQQGSEQDAVLLFSCFQQCVRGLVSQLKYSPHAVSLSSAMHSIMGVDQQGIPLTKAILWSDTRSSAIAEDLRNADAGKRIYSATGTPLHSMSPLCKIKWLQQNETDTFKKAAKFISIKEFIWHQLFQEYKVDHSIASATGLFNVHNLQWDEQALSFASITGKHLSEPVPTNYSCNNITSEVAEEMNLLPNTPFYIGASDGCLANLGSLCLDGSVAAITIGTSAAVRVTLAKPLIDEQRMPFYYLLDEKTFVCGGPVNNGGNIIQWCADKFLSNGGSTKSMEEVFALADKAPPGSKGLIFLPYLQGERAPVWDEQSSGLFFGIRSFHNQACFARAVIEGVCFALKEIILMIEDLSAPVTKLKLSGGVSQSNLVLQILADVMGKPVSVDKDGDASATGAAYLALKDLGAIETYTAIPEKESHLIKPVAENSAIYQKHFAVYKTLYPALKAFMHLHHQSTAG